MSDLNKLIVSGKLLQDSALTYTQAGLAICKFQLVSTDKYKQKVTETTFNCVMMGKPAESVAQYLKGGMGLAIVGKMQSNEYKGQRSWQVMVSETIFLGSGQKQQRPAPQPAQQQRAYPPQQRPEYVDEELIHTEPFEDDVFSDENPPF